MDDFARLKKNLKNDFSNLEPVRVALLGDTATQLLAQAIRATGFGRGFDLQIWEADFNQIEREIFDTGSDLYASDPQVIIIYHSSHKLLGSYNRLDPAAYGSLADDRLALIDELCMAIRAGKRGGVREAGDGGTRGAGTPRIIYYNYAEIDDAVFGNYSNKTESSFLFQLRKLNYELMKYAAQQPDLYIADLAALQNQMGKPAFFHSSVYVNTDMVIGIDALPAVAARTVDLIGALCGRIRKCLILDLDNTLWGGEIGDDGLENIQLGALGIGKAFTEFQHWIKKLQNRGIILAVCSKNTDSVARQPFGQHPDMVLSLEDIAVFQANWENKVDNIRQIQAILNIGYDSMVFLDDNPFERNMVREAIPAITVPELPEDPADYLEYLYTLNLFETVSVSAEDKERTRLYQKDHQRNVERQIYGNEDAWLQGLNMLSAVEPFNRFNGPRVAQLSQRSNQFNLRTVRYTEADIQRMADSPDAFTFSFTLEDRFGDNGICAVVILKKETADVLSVDTWLMSCRVLKRGMENFILNTIAGFARENGYGCLKGEYLPTAKNEMVKDHYAGLGWREEGGYWVLDIQAYEPRETHVQMK
jgi:FkbH-like protein